MKQFNNTILGPSFRTYDLVRMKLEQNSGVSEDIYYSIVVCRKGKTVFDSPQQRLGGFVIKAGKFQAYRTTLEKRWKLTKR